MNGWFKMKYGLIGKKLTHSISPYIHSLMGNIDYESKEIDTKEIEIFLQKKDFLGINVTIPYKEIVINYLDEINPLAKEIGSVNTIINKNGKLIGYNTDYYGFKQLLLENNINPNNLNCMVLGTGGTSKTIQTVLKHLGAKKIYVVSRTPNNNQISYEKAITLNDIDLIINATPKGMYPNNDEKIISLDYFNNLKAVIDVIYNPINTKLILQAKAKNITASGGLKMLIYQAIYADKLFFLKSNDAKISMSNILKKYSNIVLIGMSYSGKSTIGKKLSKVLNKEYFDIDYEIEKEVKMSVKDIFNYYEEEYFRELETKKIKDISKKQGIIISTGGGIIKNIENIFALKQNGIIINLIRDFSLINISDDSRPLTRSKQEYVELYKQRKDFYEKYSDITVFNNKDIKNCIEEIITKIDLFTREF